MKKILLLVEGLSEEIVVRNLLGPHFLTRDIYLEAVLVKTRIEKAGKAFKGGVVSFEKVRRDLKALLGDTSAAAVTTFIDYYGLPADFPGVADRPATKDPYQRVAHVEAAFAHEIDHRRFIPHLTLHELEAWIYVEPSLASWVFSNETVASKLEAIRDQCGGAEFVNEGPDTAPSRRIMALAPDYTKTVAGPAAIEGVGLERIRRSCKHADAWLNRLEALA